MSKKSSRSFGDAFVAELDKRVKREGKWITKRELFLERFIDEPRMHDSLLQFMESAPEDASGSVLVLPPNPEAIEAFRRAAKGLPPKRRTKDV